MLTKTFTKELFRTQKYCNDLENMFYSEVVEIANNIGYKLMDQKFYYNKHFTINNGLLSVSFASDNNYENGFLICQFPVEYLYLSKEKYMKLYKETINE
jgi:hypothetical protein